ncbi:MULTISPECIES: GTP-binding protein [Vitreoscilla]|uniref:ATP/GTP-binding protein n=1 Tax=Vitreoscilla stercoraria TaxID=61 RepID=A0ABY4E970_VITST|nr:MULTISPECIES: ATP/GTP-binding protein [Vitreoscilla]AUZ06419.1 hypothetical protein ADP71_32520 [Vitreoscilla sp. C1]UOO92296.1 ATP/GTP-binding protein [Vitreoscilla stercoraria]
MFEHKIIFTGPVGSGKTTLIKAFSDHDPVLTEVRPSDDVASMKNQTTVAMDYGSVVLDEETKVHMYGTPGQHRFDFMWEILSRGSMGLAILVNARAPDPLGDLRFYMEAFKKLIVEDRTPLVIGVNHIDKTNPHIAAADFKQVTDEFRPNIPVLLVDVREGKDVRRLIMSLLFAI